MKFTIILDTNVIVSFVLSKRSDSPITFLRKIIDNDNATIVYTNTIFSEYKEVLSRPKFNISPEVVEKILSSIQNDWTLVEEEKFDVEIADPKDLPFYYLTLSEKDSYLVTGNLKHFPKSARIVSPREFVDIFYTEGSDE